MDSLSKTGTSHLVVLSGAAVVVLRSEVIAKIRSVKSWKMDEVVVVEEEEAGGAVTLGGAMVFMRYTTFRPDGGPDRERS